MAAVKPDPGVNGVLGWPEGFCGVTEGVVGAAVTGGIVLNEGACIPEDCRAEVEDPAIGEACCCDDWTIEEANAWCEDCMSEELGVFGRVELVDDV